MKKKQQNISADIANNQYDIWKKKKCQEMEGRSLTLLTVGYTYVGVKTGVSHVSGEKTW
jgi:hypothetical protein